MNEFGELGKQAEYKLQPRHLHSCENCSGSPARLSVAFELLDCQEMPIMQHQHWMLSKAGRGGEERDVRRGEGREAKGGKAREGKGREKTDLQGSSSNSGSSVRETRMVSPRPSMRRDPMPMADFSLPSSPSPA